MRAVAYCRISRDATGTELGVQRQRKHIDELCEAQGIELVDVFVDNDLSAYGRKKRDGFDAMLDALARPDVDCVIGWAVDRLTRNMRTVEDIIERVQATKVRVRLVNNGEVDLNTANGRLLFRMLGAIATQESEGKQARILSKHREKLEAGEVPGGGRRPFGYEQTRIDETTGDRVLDRCTVVPSEAKIIVEVKDRLLAGESLYRIATSLNERNVPTTTDRVWSSTTLRQMILTPRVAGLRVDKRTGETFDAVWDAIITPDDHRRLLALFSNPARKTNHGGRRPYLLQGLLRCGECGTMLSGKPRQDGKWQYICRREPGRSGCGSICAIATPIEEIVTKAVRECLAGGALDRLAAVEHDSTDADDLAELTRIDEQLEALGVRYAEPDAPIAMLEAAGRELQRRKVAANDRLRASQSNAQRVALVDAQRRLSGAWPSDVPSQRAIICEVLSTVIIHKARARGVPFDPARVVIPADGWRV